MRARAPARACEISIKPNAATACTQVRREVASKLVTVPLFEGVLDKSFVEALG
eukprot:SAG11_NODE_1590_length_4624_cov_3.572376_2_plen_53_part_00